MIEQGLVTAEMIDHYADIYENQVGPQLGARVVARAWVDSEFKSRLLEDAPAACLRSSCSAQCYIESVSGVRPTSSPPISGDYLTTRDSGCPII